MTSSTPYLPYILGAYGITLVSLSFYLGRTLIQWKRSRFKTKNTSHET